MIGSAGTVQGFTPLVCLRGEGRSVANTLPNRCPKCGVRRLEDTPQVIYCPAFTRCGYRTWKQDLPLSETVELQIFRDTRNQHMEDGVPTVYVKRWLKVA